MGRPFITLVCTLVVALVVSLAGAAHAHQSSYTYASMSLSESQREVHYEIRLSSKDLFEALGLEEDRDATEQEILRAGGLALRGHVFERIQLRVPGQNCTFSSEPVKVLEDGQRFAQVQTTVRCNKRIEAFEISYDLFFDLDERHEGLLRIDDGLIQFTNSSRSYKHVFGDAAPDSSLGFLRSGANHVLFGLDHILFLISLLMVVCLRQESGGLRARTIKESLRSAAGIVTAFTVGHSITLIIAALGWIALPSRFVESMIAASIVYVAVENVLRPDPPRRYLVTLTFGLMHGLGFASMLRPLLPPEDVVLPLLVFNVGVEVGQLAVVAVTLPVLGAVLWALGVPRYRRWVLPISSALLSLAGATWLAQRALGL